MINIIKDPKTGITDVIYLCFKCDPDIYPRGKPIVNDPGATKDLNTGKWICSSCQEESLNKMFLRTLGINPSEGSMFQCFIAAEERKVRKHNDAARRLNEVSGQYLMSYKRNKYTGSMPLSASSMTTPTARKTIGERATYSKETGLQTLRFGPTQRNKEARRREKATT